MKKYVVKPLLSFQTLINIMLSYLGSLLATAVIEHKSPTSTLAENLIIGILWGITVRYTFYFKNKSEVRK